MVGNKLNKEAVESYSNSFSAKILDEFFADNQAISGQQILEITPIKQVNFFILKVLFLQWQSETKKFQSPFFDYNNQDVKHALKALVNTLSKNILIKKDHFKPLLETAVVDTLDLMYDPTEFYIREFTNLPNTTRIQGFKGLAKYIKINKNIYNKINEKLDLDGRRVITDDEIKTLVQFVMGQEQIDEEVIVRESKLFESIVDLDIFEKPEPEEEVIEEELESDTAPDVGDIVIELEDENDSEELGEIIIDKDELEEIEQELPEEESIVIDTDDAVEPVVEESLDEEFSPVSAQVETPTKKQKVQDSLNEKYSEEVPTINQKFENQKSSIAEVHETEKVSEIQKSINVNQRYMFLNDLFRGDVKVYDVALEEVEQSNSFDDSVEILVQKYSKKFEWDMNSDEVKELLKVIFKRFR